jgi:hypothetical protein
MIDINRLSQFRRLLFALLLCSAVCSVALSEMAALARQQLTAKLITRGNQSIIVNGISTGSGAALLTGATIETPDSISATIDLGPLGSLDLAPNTRVKLDYSEGKVKVTLISGCLILRTKKSTSGSVETSQGTAGRNEKSKGGALDVCFPTGASQPTVNQSAAANAGAGVLDSALNNGPASAPNAASNPANAARNLQAEAGAAPNAAPAAAPQGCILPLGHAPKTADGVGRVDARIMDEQGHPIQGAKLKLKSHRTNGILCESWNTSNECGQALLPPLHIGPQLTLTIEAAGFQKQTINLDASSLDQPVEIKLLRKI